MWPPFGNKIAKFVYGPSIIYNDEHFAKQKEYIKLKNFFFNVQIWNSNFDPFISKTVIVT
jgi:hypothetical protein